MLGDTPFVLLDDCRSGGGPARLYRAPLATIVASRADEVVPALAQIRSAQRDGRHVAGYIAYEAGHALEPRLAALARGVAPLLWFGVFADVETPAPDAVAALLPDPRGAFAGRARPRLDRAGYDAAFARVTKYLRAGDIYQANLSFRADVDVLGPPLALYARLRGAGAGWGGIVFTGAEWLLSASPELFFTLDGNAIVARPMKGTMRRGATPAADAAAAAALAADPKERAENLMIVDLLRNDIARIAVPGSVAVPALFTRETYPTLHTLTSTITATLAAGRDAVDVVTALFPCGSVTGAPKIRAMEIIAELENAPRGAYTGSLGWLAPDGDAAFNVVIRTLALPDAADAAGRRRATLGLGSAVVADSTADAEWAECLAKAAFVMHGAAGIGLIETMSAEPGDGIVDRDRHLARLKASAAALELTVPDDLVERLAAATAGLTRAMRARLVLAPDGSVSIELGEMPAAHAGPVEVALVPLPVDPADFRLRHKTTDRAFYDAARRSSDAFEAVFVDADGFVTEGSFTTVFVERNGTLLTPPATRGLLPGILRQRLLETGRAREAELRPADLTDGFQIGNALRGLMPATLRTNDRR